jgi:hypothetical protein
MRHTTQELLAIAHEYFPRGMQADDPGFPATPHAARQKAACVSASERYDAWFEMLERLRTRFPKEQFPDLRVEDGSPFLRVATAEPLLDRCFTGRLWLPTRGPNERHHYLELLVSFVVPYYIVCSYTIGFPPDRSAMFGGEHTTRFDFSGDERPFAEALKQEIATTFPDHEPIPPDVGLTVVPDVQAGNKWFGEATIFTCLFSHSW